MTETPFLQVFKNYSPSLDHRKTLQDATVLSNKVKKDEEGNIVSVEVCCRFPYHIMRNRIDELEASLFNYYKEGPFKYLTIFRIIPKFPASEFKLSYVHDIAEEATRCGAMARGFFDLASISREGNTIIVELPFAQSGVDLINEAKTKEYLHNITIAWFDLDLEYKIVVSSDAEEKSKARLQEYERLILQYQQKAEGQQSTGKESSVQVSNDNSDSSYSNAEVLFNTPSSNEKVGEHEFKIGHLHFIASAPEFVFGVPFEIDNPTPIGDVKKPKNEVLLLGEIFKYETKDVKNKEKLQLTIGITDGVHSIYVKRTSLPDDFPWLGNLKVGNVVALKAKVYEDRFNPGDLNANLLAIAKIKKASREDKSEEKRTELHLHTTMSQMDAFISPADLVATAVKWGWKSVAVTDHGNVQGYPEMMIAKAKQKADNLKILWGIEAYYVNDKARAIYGTKLPSFEDEMIVFDIETTGLDSKNSEIIEIGAVKVQNGEVLEEFDTFIKPINPIGEETTQLTSITNEMVADAPDLKTALRSFLDFAGDRLLIAHNANFDCGFIRAASEKCNFSFTNTYLDTVALSRYLNPELKKHKLDSLADFYGLGDFHHHRGADDARMLSLIFFKMMEQLKNEGIRDFKRMSDSMSEKSDPLKLRTYHMVIFAKNLEGLKTLYKLISASYLQYFKRFPRIPRSILEGNRSDLIIGSACESGELYQALLDNQPEAAIEEIASFYDYLEIQPNCNNRFLISEGRVASEEALEELNKRIYNLGKKLGKPVVATCDAHFLNKEDELYRKIILKGMKYADGDKDTGIYLRNTEEMLKEFSYLGEDIAREVVIENPNKIADMVEEFRPIPEGRYEPNMEGAEEDLINSCWQRATEWYGYDAGDGKGPVIPEIVSARLKRELDAIINNHFAVLYMIAVKLVAYSESQGYLVGSRGSVGSSFVASMSGISEVNPLPPHYRCPHCKYSEFFTDGSVGSGFDMPDKKCPKCGTEMLGDGHDIPFETFLGFKGDKSPDIDLNFSGEVQGKVHKYTEVLFGEGHVFRAGTVSNVADKTAYGYVIKYLEEKGMKLNRAELDELALRVSGVKRTTGQHPGGIIVIPKEYDVHDFTPVQHPADDPNSSIITTHFQFTYLHDTILKLDELGHDMPTKYKMLEKYTNTSVLDVKMNDPKVYQLFESCESLGVKPEDIGGCKLGTYGLPEMGTSFVQGVLIEAKPKNFADLLQIMGLTHGTDVWLGNAQELIKNNICDISHVIGTRDGIMLDLIRFGLPNGDSFKIMESVRKGRGLTPEWEELMRSHNVPEWYIDSCKKIKYMFPKAHAAAYGMSAIRLGWYKIHYPLEFYAAFLSVAPGGFDAQMVLKGKEFLRSTINAIKEKPANEITQKDKEMVATFQLVEESMARGIEYLPPHLYKSDHRHFLPEDGKIRIPFSALGGLGETAAQKIVEARDAGTIYSIDELRVKAGLSKSVIDLLREIHALDGLTETNQFSFF